MALPGNKYDSDADDEYERSVITSPIIETDDDTSAHDSDGPSNENTPTTFGYQDNDRHTPRTIITEWTTDECAKFIKDLGLPQYCEFFLENEIVGEALVALRHEELKEMGVNSVGHRLTILKAVYEVKVKQDIPIESDDYVPLSADTSYNTKKATQEDITRIVQSIKLRDERIIQAETELRKIQEEYRKLREEILPLFRMAKERSQPLPYQPSQNSPDLSNNHDGLASPVLAEPPQQKSSLARKFSKKSLWLNSTPKNASPTHIPQTIKEGKFADASLDPSAAAVAASSHLTASLNGGPSVSPSQANMPSPTSPNTYHNQPTISARNYTDRDNRSAATRTTYQNPDDHHFSYSSTASTLNPDTTSSQTSYRREPSATPRTTRPMTRLDRSHEDDGPNSGTSLASSTSGPLPGPAFPTSTMSSASLQPSNASIYSTTSTINPPSQSSSGSSSAPSVEIFKSFRVSMEDPCYKVLPAALKKYNINADWRQYALYIVFGDQERCLGLDEKPLILFKQLDKEGRKPMFMLRRHASPAEGHTGMTTAAPGVGMGSGNFGGSGIQLPGGVL